MAKTETAQAAEKPAKDKAGQFKKVVEPRVGKALAAIAVVGNCANKASYEYSEEQVAVIEKALQGEVAKTMARFRNPSAAPKASFSLS